MMAAAPARSLRLLLVLSHSLHIRNFLASGLLETLLARGHTLRVVAPGEFVSRVRGDLEGKGRLEGVEPLEPYVGGRLRERMRGVFRTASLVQRSHLSTYRHKLLLRSKSPDAALQISALRRLGRVVDLERAARAIESRIPVNAAALGLMRRARPDLVVTPTFIHDTLDLEIVKAARRLSVPVAGFPASWDTLTSKGFFLAPPDALLVWGEDSLRHAADYHGYSPDRVFVTGPPHFDIYGPAWAVESRDVFLSRRGIPPDKRVLLFAGTTLTYWADEPLQLRALSRLVETGELAGCVIWYRPHPRRSARDVSELLGLPGVHVDDQMMRHKAGSRSSYSLEPEDLAHYRSLMDACEGVIAAFSTMIIEAALLGKPSLVVAFGLGDGGPERLLQHTEYEHMRDVISTPGVTVCRSLEELTRGIRGVLRGEFASFSEVLRKRAGEIARCLDGRARARVVEALEALGARRGAR